MVASENFLKRMISSNACATKSLKRICSVEKFLFASSLTDFGSIPLARSVRHLAASCLASVMVTLGGVPKDKSLRLPANWYLKTKQRCLPWLRTKKAKFFSTEYLPSGRSSKFLALTVGIKK